MTNNVIQFKPRKTTIRNNAKRNTAYNIGIRDLPSNEIRNQDGTNTVLYKVWSSMLQRCYSQSFLSKFPTYRGCSVCEEWLTLSEFKKWFDAHYIEGYELDKDLLFKGNKIYSPQTCVFIPKHVNSFISAGGKGKLMRGVSLRPDGKKYIANIFDIDTKKPKYLGSFNTECEAHHAYLTKKNEYAYQVIAMYPNLDIRVKNALATRFAVDKNAA
ncbi:hypothetical protein KGV31_002143 [Vibrio parahaemolyticus]|nr:hypothetical protein [Vibrio parahaemolyticus]EHU0344287.1 hypothetical protein [Vibrio parahaemolyticus]EHU0354321.1 hypothetical protein [Vibrio parahaemolyticus]